MGELRTWPEMLIHCLLHRGLVGTSLQLSVLKHALQPFLLSRPMAFSSLDQLRLEHSYKAIVHIQGRGKVHGELREMHSAVSVIRGGLTIGILAPW